MNEKITHKQFHWPILTEKTKEAVLIQMDDSISIYDKSSVFERFESGFASMHNRKYSLLTNSGTNALFSLYVGANLKSGDEVICPAYTFFATVTPLFFTGAKPVLCDVDNLGNLNPDLLESLITSRTKAIIVTHMWGNPCQMDKIVSIAKKYDLLLFEDCSHAHGATYKNKLVGTFGSAAAWSLQGQKTLTGGEGGIILTDDKEIFQRSLLLGHYNKRCKQEIPKDSKYYKFVITGMGLKFRAHPLAIAIVEEQMNSLNKTLELRRMNAKFLINSINKIEGLKVVVDLKNSNPSWYAMIIKYDKSKFNNINIEEFCNGLIEKGCSYVDIPGSTCPLNLLPLFQNPGELFDNYNTLSYSKKDFPKAREFYNSIFKIPVFNDDGTESENFINSLYELVNDLRGEIYD